MMVLDIGAHLTAQVTGTALVTMTLMRFAPSMRKYKLYSPMRRSNNTVFRWGEHCCTTDEWEATTWANGMDWSTQATWAENDYEACFWNDDYHYEECIHGRS